MTSGSKGYHDLVRLPFRLWPNSIYVAEPSRVSGSLFRVSATSARTAERVEDKRLSHGRTHVGPLAEANWRYRWLTTGNCSSCVLLQRLAVAQLLNKLLSCGTNGRLYSFFRVIPRRLNFMCRRFGTVSVPSS